MELRHLHCHKRAQLIEPVEDQDPRGHVEARIATLTTRCCVFGTNSGRDSSGPSGSAPRHLETALKRVCRLIFSSSLAASRVPAYRAGPIRVNRFRRFLSGSCGVRLPRPKAVAAIRSTPRRACGPAGSSVACGCYRTRCTARCQFSPDSRSHRHAGTPPRT